MTQLQDPAASAAAHAAEFERIYNQASAPVAEQWAHQLEHFQPPVQQVMPAPQQTIVQPPPQQQQQQQQPEKWATEFADATTKHEDEDYAEAFAEAATAAAASTTDSTADAWADEYEKMPVWLS